MQFVSKPWITPGLKVSIRKKIPGGAKKVAL